MRKSLFERLLEFYNITKEEYDTVSSYMMLLGLENGYMQEHESADSSYVPDWNML